MNGYRVAWGVGESNEAYFATWEEALPFARERRGELLKRRNPYDSVSIYNDAATSDENETGLTVEQWEEWSHG